MKMKIVKKVVSNNKRVFYGFRKAFIQNNEISPLARFTLIMLFTFKGKNESCWPSVGKLASCMGINRDTTRKYINELVSKGYVIKKSRGIGRSLLYTPSYWKISSGNNKKKVEKTEPAEKTIHQPAEITLNRSINTENKDKAFKSGKELFEQKRKELGL